MILRKKALRGKKCGRSGSFSLSFAALLPALTAALLSGAIFTIPAGNARAAASCTTNAIVPVLKAMNDKFGIVHGQLNDPRSLQGVLRRLDVVLVGQGGGGDGQGQRDAGQCMHVRLHFSCSLCSLVLRAAHGAISKEITEV